MDGCEGLVSIIITIKDLSNGQAREKDVYTWTPQSLSKSVRFVFSHYPIKIIL